MSRYINRYGISSQNSNTAEKIANKIIIHKAKEQEKPKKGEVSLNLLNVDLFPFINSKIGNSLPEGTITFKNNNSNNENQISNNLTKKKESIFSIRKVKRKKTFRRKHDANAKDNIKRTIITDFINFFLSFINLSIKQKIKKEKIKIDFEEIQFKIGFDIKSKIKVDNILYSTIESFLLLDEMKIQKNGKNMNKNKTYFSNTKKNFVNNKSNNNKQKIKIIRTIFDCSLNTFFDTKIKTIFKEIYLKSRKIVDLKKYGMQGIVLKIPKNLQTFTKLKKKKNNRKKEKIMNDLIKNQFINPKKRRISFKIQKKE